MATMIIRHTVKNYEIWRKGFEKQSVARDVAGLTSTMIYQSPDDPNEIVVIHEMADRQRAETFAASDDVQLVNARLGVIGLPEIYYA